MSENVPLDMHSQRRFRSACTYLIRVFIWCILDSQGCKVSSCKQRRHWSDWVDAQTDFSLFYAYKFLKFGFISFCTSAHFSNYKQLWAKKDLTVKSASKNGSRQHSKRFHLFIYSCKLSAIIKCQACLFFFSLKKKNKKKNENILESH